jgi:hypothetical protein
MLWIISIRYITRNSKHTKEIKFGEFLDREFQPHYS